jgi:hypothetical protein
MQLHLETDELSLVSNVLLERICNASDQGVPSGSGQPYESMRLDPHFFDNLLDKILARDLRLDADELEQLCDLLNAQRLKLIEQIARAQNATLQAEMQRNLGLLDRVAERVSEACVMF